MGSVLKSCSILRWPGRHGWSFREGVYDLVVRGNERAAVFRNDEDREKYLGRLAPNSAGFQD